MDESKAKQPLFKVVLDEIALEGLEGTTIPTLWQNISHTLEMPEPFGAELNQMIWNVVLEIHSELEFYILPEPRKILPHFNRFENLDPDLAVPIIPANECPYMRYKYNPIMLDDAKGSCEHFNERRSIPYDNIKHLSKDDILKAFGAKFIIVACQSARFSALYPFDIGAILELSISDYCVLEAIGRSRYNGQTVAGPWSLQYLCDEPSFIFYIKKKLLNLNMISKQNYTEKCGGYLSTTLLTLKRFYCHRTNTMSLIIKRLFDILKTQPGFKMPLSDALTLFKMKKHNTLRKIIEVDIFNNVFKIQSDKENTTDSNLPLDLKGISHQMVSIREPELVIEEYLDDFDNDNLSDDGDNTVVSQASEIEKVYVPYSHRPLPDRLYSMVLKHGEHGCNINDILENFPVSRLIVRAVLKKLCDSKHIETYFKEAGRQRVAMFRVRRKPKTVTPVMEETKDEKEGEQQQKQKPEQTSEQPNKLCCNDTPKLPQIERHLKDIPEIKATVKTFPLDKYKVPKNTNNERFVLRKRMIIEAIDECCIIAVSTLRNKIQTNEMNSGLNVQMCRKSLYRILHDLCLQNIIKVNEIITQYENEVRTNRFVLHPKINDNHPVIINQINKLKAELFASIEEKRHKKMLAHTANEKKNKNSPTSLTTRDHQSSKDRVNQLPSECRAPKFLISRYLHEFLFFVLFELKRQRRIYPLTLSLIEHWNRIHSSPQLQELITDFKDGKIDEVDTNVIAYSKELNWRTFIPPMPKNNNKPEGWVFFMDVLDRMPLSIFKKIFTIDKDKDDNISAFINHPIRQHYLMCNTPPSIRHKVNLIHMQRVYTSILKLLNNMGLIQMGERPRGKEALMVWIYFNRKLSIRDTTSSKMSYNKVDPNIPYPTHHFQFQTSEELQNFWERLQRICVYTKLGFRRNKNQNDVCYKAIEYLPSVSFEDAPNNDNGKIPGDGLGAAGFSSYLFAHTFRSWSWTISVRRPKLKKDSTQLTTSSRAKESSSNVVIVEENDDEEYEQPIPVEVDLTTDDNCIIDVDMYDEEKRENTTIKAAASNNNINMNVVNKEKTSSPKTKAERKTVKKKSGPRDDIDRDALRNMKTLRVTWNKDEDRILCMSKAAAMYIDAPLSLLGQVTMGKVSRDLIRRVLGYHNKTTQACVRRIQFITRQKRHLPEVPSWLYILQSNDYMQKNYPEGFVNMLKKLYPYGSTFLDKLTIHLILIVRKLYELLSDKSDLKGGLSSVGVSEGDKFRLPNTMVEFHKLYKELQPVEKETDIVHYQNPQKLLDVQISVIIGVLHSSLCSIRDKTLYNLQLFEIYKEFPEDTLQMAFDKARKNGMVVNIKRKTLNLRQNNFSGPPFTFSSKYKCRLMFLRIPYDIFDSLYNFNEKFLYHFYSKSELLSSQNREQLLLDGETRTLEMKSPNMAHMYFIAEGFARNILKIDIKIPSSMLTVDADQQEMSSTERISGHYQTMLENAPEREYSRCLEQQGNSERKVMVKFRPANRSYKINYPVYDFISKLPQNRLHFFCVVASIGQNVTFHVKRLMEIINTKTTTTKTINGNDTAENDNATFECPLKCILSKSDYLVIIRDLIQDRCDLLDYLNDENRIQFNFEDISKTDWLTLQITKDNMLPIARAMERIWYKIDEQMDRKDFGCIINTKLRIIKDIDWHQVCREIYNYHNCSIDDSRDDDLEFEPTLNRESAARAQDVFVINLPTLQLQLNPKYTKDTNADLKMSTHRGIEIPHEFMSYQDNKEKANVLQSIIDASRCWNGAQPLDEKLFKMILIQRGFSEKEETNLNVLLKYLQSNPLGATLQELKAKFPFPQSFLVRALEFLIERSIIGRAGVDTFQFVHKSHMRHWLVRTFNLKRLECENIGGAKAAVKRAASKDMGKDAGSSSRKIRRVDVENNTEAHSDENLSDSVDPAKEIKEDEVTVNENKQEREYILMRPVPWMRLNGSVNRRVLDRWMGSILTECLARCGSTVREICFRFSSLFPVDVMFLLEVLRDIKCLKLTQVQVPSIGLFSNFTSIKEADVHLVYNPDLTYVTVNCDAALRFSAFLGDKKYAASFI